MTRLDLFKDAKTAIEVGTLQGDFAKEITDKWPTIKLVCVDYWPGKFIEYRGKWKTWSLNVPNVSLVEKPSVEAAKEFAEQSFDIVYIDAAHDYLSVRSDLDAWWPVVKSGGILSGHDFEQKPDDGFWGPIEVQSAVLDWAAKFGLKVNKTDEHDCPSWWVVKP